MKKEIISLLYEYINRNINLAEIKEEDITETTHLSNDLAMDSLDTTEFVMDLEKHYSVTVNDKDYEQMKTVGDIIHVMQNLTGYEQREA